MLQSVSQFIDQQQFSFLRQFYDNANPIINNRAVVVVEDDKTTINPLLTSALHSELQGSNYGSIPKTWHGKTVLHLDKIGFKPQRRHPFTGESVPSDSIWAEVSDGRFELFVFGQKVHYADSDPKTALAVQEGYVDALLAEPLGRGWARIETRLLEAKKPIAVTPTEDQLAWLRAEKLLVWIQNSDNLQALFEAVVQYLADNFPDQFERYSVKGRAVYVRSLKGGQLGLKISFKGSDTKFAATPDELETEVRSLWPGLTARDVLDMIVAESGNADDDHTVSGDTITVGHVTGSNIVIGSGNVVSHITRY